MKGLIRGSEQFGMWGPVGPRGRELKKVARLSPRGTANGRTVSN
jgi:hypothetical protein